MSNIPPDIATLAPAMTAGRHDIHAHPELGFEEHRTADLVAGKLKEFGLEVYTDVGRTGVVGALRVGNGTRSVGLRGNMDALPTLRKQTLLAIVPPPAARCMLVAMMATLQCC